MSRLTGETRVNESVFATRVVDGGEPAKICAWLKGGDSLIKEPYQSKLYVDRGIACSFEILAQWYVFEEMVTLPAPARREFTIGQGESGLLHGDAGSAVLHFTPGLIRHDLRDRESRRQNLRRQIRDQEIAGVGFHNTRFRDDWESLGEEPNTVAALADFVTRPPDGRGQIAISCVQYGIHYMLEYYGTLNRFSEDTIELILHSFRFPPAEVVNRLRDGRMAFYQPGYDPLMSIVLAQIVASRR